MKRKHEQVALDDWPPNLSCYLAMLKLEPAEIAASTGVLFSESSDDLDQYTGAILHLFGDRYVALTRHKNNPTKGTVITVTDSMENPVIHLDEILGYLGFESADIVWRNPVLFDKK